MNKSVSLLFLFMAFTSIDYAQTISPVEPAIYELKGLNNVRDFSLSNDGKEAFTTVQSPLGDISVIVNLKKNEGKWSQPDLLSFSGKYTDLEPFLSPDNLRLYFASNRPIDNSTNQVKDFDIWYVERLTKDSAWGSPINAGPVINSSKDEYYPAITSSGNIYFTCVCDESKKDDIYLSEKIKDGYQKPVSLGPSVNTEGYEFNAYVSPNDDLLLFSGYGRPDGFGGGDLYFSVKDNEGNWKPATNLGDKINSKYLDYCPFVDMKTGTLYFTSRRSALSNAEPITSYNQLSEILDHYDNGQSRIYKAKWKN